MKELHKMIMLTTKLYLLSNFEFCDLKSDIPIISQKYKI